jgi:surface antigen
MRYFICFVVAFTLSGYSSCLAQNSSQNGFSGLLGSLGGTGLGTLLGNQLGAKTATAVGTAVGGFVGNEIEQYLDPGDQKAMAQSTQSALSSPVGQPVPWSNPESGRSGTVTTQSQTDASGATCRVVQQQVVVQGQLETQLVNFCQQPDGTWTATS